MGNKYKPLVSLVIPTKNEGDYIRLTLESAVSVKINFPFEIIVVDDGSSDGCCESIKALEISNNLKIITTEGIGLARAKNLGAEHSTGEYLIFCDAHLFFEDLWIDRLLEPIIIGQADGTTPGIAAIHMPEAVGYGQTLNSTLSVEWNGWCETPFPCAILPGGCFAVSRNIFFEIGGFDNGFRIWGWEDVDISIKMWLFGYKCQTQPHVKIFHLFRESYPYQVTYEDIYYNMLRMAYSHFNEKRINKCKELMEYANPEHVEAMVLERDVLEQRCAYFLRRKYDDDWFMDKFGIPF